MNWIIYTIIGAVGGLVTTANWKLNNWSEKIKISKVIRNISLGAISGGFFGTSTNDIVVAFFTGTAGEFYVQKACNIIGSKLDRDLSR